MFRLLKNLRTIIRAASFSLVHASLSAPTPPLECELFLAESTIPGAGIGIFSGVTKVAGDHIGNGDKAIPMVDAYWHNGEYHGNSFFNPTADYVWDGVSMGMRLELFDPRDLSAFWPGIDAMVNCHAGLLNLQKSNPVYDEGGIRRAMHPGAGGVSPYDTGDVASKVIRDIPEGAELFKSYGDQWFLGREHLGQIPVSDNYAEALQLMTTLTTNDTPIASSVIYDELVQPLKQIWDSRSLNALFDFSWKDIETAVEAGDIGVLLQPTATRSMDWLNEKGKCLDHIVHKRSTIDGAGAGAFAKRNLPKGTVVTGTPLLVFPDIKFFDMYDFQTCPKGEKMVRDMSEGPYTQQLLINYCFGHPESDIALCPYGMGVNYINHDRERANVKVQWGQDGIAGHFDKFFETPTKNMTDYSTKVAFDYVATKDIAEGEEIFLDYGDDWDEKWKQLTAAWEFYDHTGLDSYQSAAEFNELHSNDYLWTAEELAEYYPYPDNLSTRCHYILDEYEHESAFYGELSMFDDWYNWQGDNTGFPCDVLGRSEDNEKYVVHFTTYDEWATSKTLHDVPREAIKFFNNPYTTDMHMIGAFRHPIGIPDEMLPDAWRRSTDEPPEEKITEDMEEICAELEESSQEDYRISRLPRRRSRGA